MRERAETESHGEAHAESARMRAEIRIFLESYRAHSTDASQVLNNMVTLCDLYRTHGFAEAHCELLGVIDQPPAHAFVNVLWTIRRHGSLPLSRFRTSYNLRRDAGRWRVLLCTAYEERSPDAFRHD